MARRVNARSTDEHFHAHPFLQLERDAQNPRRGRIVQRMLNLGGEVETRRYAYDSAGRLARVTDERGGLLESYQYDHEGRRLADLKRPIRP